VSALLCFGRLLLVLLLFLLLVVLWMLLFLASVHSKGDARDNLSLEPFFSKALELSLSLSAFPSAPKSRILVRRYVRLFCAVFLRVGTERKRTPFDQ